MQWSKDMTKLALQLLATPLYIITWVVVKLDKRLVQKRQREAKARLLAKHKSKQWSKTNVS